MKIVQATGQTCNQFWIYSNFLSDAIENKQKFAIWVPDISLREFSNLRNSKFVFFPLYSDRLVKWIGYERYISLLSNIFLNRYFLFLTNLIFKVVPNYHFIIADIGLMTSQFNFKYLNYIKEIFKPNLEVDNPVNLLFDVNRNKFDIIIGIHIRYGDYRTYQNGKYFYSLEKYNSFIKKVESLFIGQNVTFFIASNENIDFSNFSNFSNFYIAKSTPINDLIGLSKCDYICGPPSSFSAWASLYNHTPLYFIEDVKKEIFLENFFHIEDLWFLKF